MKAKINLLNLLVVASLVLTVVGLPVNVQAATTPVAPDFQVTPNGFIVSEPTVPANTAGLPPASSAPAQVEEESELLGALPLPRILKDLASTVTDLALQSQPGMAAAMPSPIRNWEGIPATGVYPPDTDGQVGPNHYVQIVNASGDGSWIRIWDKSGNQLYNFGMNGLWPTGDRCRDYGYGDPVVLYDQLADRWILTQFTNPPSGPYNECFAISKTGTPTNVPGDWWLYTFNVHGTKFNDYPKIGVWPDGYYMMAHQFTSVWAGTGVWVFDRTKMLNGQVATFQYKDLEPVNTNYGGMLPSNLMGNTLPPVGSPNYFVEVDSVLDTMTNTMTIFAFHTDWITPTNTSFTIANQLSVVPFDGEICNAYRGQCINQPGTTVKLEGISDRLMMHAWYRNYGDHEGMVFNHTVDSAFAASSASGVAGIRWYEIRKTTPVTNTWSIYQQGTFSPDTNHRWMGSIAQDHVGNIALGYSVSSATVYPSIRYTGRLPGDPLGTLNLAEGSIITGTGSQTGTAARWGDYSAMSVDPVDDCTFWYTQEYMQTTSATGWQTRIASFKFPNCALGAQGTLNGTVTSGGNPVAGAKIDAAATLTQTGSALSAGDGSYSMSLLTGSYTVTVSAYGYNAQTVTGVTIAQDVTTTQNFNLVAAPTYVVSGTVKDALTGWPLYAKLTIAGYPGPALWTNPVTGYYSVTVVGSTAYTFNAAAFSTGYQPSSQAVGPLSSNATVNLDLTADQLACTAPGYRISGGLAENFDSVTTPALPTGWAKVVVTTTTTAADWATNAGTRYPSGQPAHSAPNLVYFNSFSAGTGGAARLYRTSGLNMTTVPTTTLSFWMYHDTGYTSNNDRVQVQVSTNGTTWTNVGAPVSRYNGTTTWTQHTVDLSAYAAQTIQLGLLGISAYGNDVHIDDIALGAPSCRPSAGGLVVGNVADANTAAELNGAGVQNQGGYNTSSVATPQDPNTPDGFYTLFSPAGTQTFTATKTSYGLSVVSASVVQSSTIRQNFNLPAGIVSYTPAGLQATLRLGQVVTQNLTLNNTGGTAATFALQEADQGKTPLFPSQTRPPYKRRIMPYSDPSELAPLGTKVPGTPPTPNLWGSAAPLPAAARYRSAGATCDGSTYYVFGGSPDTGVTAETWKYDSSSNTWTSKAPMPVALMSMEAACIDGYIYLVGGYTGAAHTNAFQIYNTANNTWVNTTWPNIRTPMTAVWSGKLYAFGGNPGPSAETWVYDPGTATWTNLNAPMASATSYGAATAMGDYIYVVGSGTVAQRYNPVANTWTTGPSLPAQRMNAMLVWYGDKLYAASGGGSGGDVWTGYNDTLVLDTSTWPAGSWTAQGEIVPQPIVGAAYECVKNRIYGTAGTSGGINYAITQYLDDGLQCHTSAGVPWLSPNPITGTIAPAASLPIDVIFDASVITTTGQYHAKLNVSTNTPYPVTSIPVTMTVIPPLAQLTVNKVGNGTVNQIPVPPYGVGDVVTLTATPATGWSFAGWSGALSGTTSPITITLTSDKVVTATFTSNPVNLTVNVVGSGTVAKVPDQAYLYGDVVTLTANAATNWAFAGWSGALSGTTNPITITLTGDKVVTATFVSTCVPVNGVDFTYLPTAPKVNKIVTFDGTATGTTPITYTWDFGDSSAVGSGTPITHLFPITLTTHSYTVTMTAANACSTVPVLKSLTVQPQTTFLPIVKK